MATTLDKGKVERVLAEREAIKYDIAAAIKERDAWIDHKLLWLREGGARNAMGQPVVPLIGSAKAIRIATMSAIKAAQRAEEEHEEKVRQRNESMLRQSAFKSVIRSAKREASKAGELTSASAPPVRRAPTDTSESAPNLEANDGEELSVSAPPSLEVPTSRSESVADIVAKDDDSSATAQRAGAPG